MFPYPNIEPFSYEEVPTDFHSVTSISLAELIEGGFYDWKDKSWEWDYFDREQYERVCTKFVNRYYARDISVIPPGQWKREYKRLFNEIMPKYKPLYQAIKDGVNLLTDTDHYGKSRDIYSEFPQTMLGDNQDYASTGRDREYEDITTGNFIDNSIAIAKRYKDIDILILDELSILFSCLMSVNVNSI